jgi:radical SAM superfamily enzyme YgiQ (UPF0313 family)
LASYLRKHGLDCAIKELGIFNIEDAVKKGQSVRFGLSDEAIEEMIRNEHPKIVGITCMYSIYFKDVLEIASTIKKVDPRIKVVLGGNHASSFASQILKNRNIDIIVIGEGEVTFLELARKILNEEPTHDVEGIVYLDKNNKIIKTKERQFISNLDEIPFPLVEIVNYRKYLGNGNPFALRSPTACIVSSRGCPGKCVYCTVSAVWGRTWRGRSPKNVVDEIESLMKNYQVSEFAFLDDSASLDRKRWEGICDEIIRRKLGIKWTTPNGIAHWTLTKEILDKMKKAGCYRVTFGIESGDIETRKFLGKPYPLEQARELIQHANRIGMWTMCTNIIGFPYEKLDSIKRTIKFAMKSGTDFACFYLLMPQPTSKVYQFFKKEGLINFDSFFEDSNFDEKEFQKMNHILNETGSDTLHFKKEELNRLQKEAYRSFILYRALTYFLNPFRLIRKINSVEDAFYILRLICRGGGIFFRTMNPLNKKSSDYLYSGTKANIDK